MFLAFLRYRKVRQESRKKCLQDNGNSATTICLRSLCYKTGLMVVLFWTGCYRAVAVHMCVNTEHRSSFYFFAR